MEKVWKAGRTFVLLIPVYSIIAFAAGEIFVRFAMSSDWERLAPFGKAAAYADWFSDDHWKLMTLLKEGEPSATIPHPLLGWTGDFSKETYLHNRASEVGDRRPVLLFGDSFAKGKDPARRLESFLNADVDLSQEYYFLNYGTNGYGLDQIYLLMREAIGQFEDPIVIFGFMTLDLDRVVLTVRPQQKPYFESDDDDLVLHTPTQMVISDHLSDHPPEIRSYLFRFLIHSDWFPADMGRRLQHVDRREENIKQLSTVIIERALDELRGRKLDYLILVFHADWPGISPIDGEDWRDRLIRQVLVSKDEEFIWAKELIYTHRKETGSEYDEYFLVGDGHPSTLYNRLVAIRIKETILGAAPGERPLQSSTRSLIDNGSFEVWNDGKPSWWGVHGNGISRSSDTTDGESSVELMHVTDGDSTWIQQMMPLEELELGRKIRVTVDAKSSEKGALGFNVYFTREDGEREAFSTSHSGNGQWEPLTHEILVPADADPSSLSCLLTLRSGATSPAYIDNVTATIID